MTRHIGIQYRTGGKYPTSTVVVIHDGKKRTELVLKLNQDDLDFVREKLPESFRAVHPEDKPSDFYDRHITWKALEDGKVAPEHQTKTVKGVTYYMHKVPKGYHGLRKDDVVGIMLGGTGGDMAKGLYLRGKEIGAEVWRVPSNTLEYYCARTEFARRDPVNAQRYEQLLYTQKRTPEETTELHNLTKQVDAIQKEKGGEAEGRGRCHESKPWRTVCRATCAVGKQEKASFLPHVRERRQHD